MTPIEKSAVETYLTEVSKLLKTGVSTEHTFRPALSGLLSALLPNLTPINEAKRCKCGAPDFILIDSVKLPIMYVETKDIDDHDLDGKKKSGNKEQFDRYKAAFDSIVFSDFLDFHFYRHNGEFVDAVRIAEWDGSKLTANSDNFEDFVTMLQDAASVPPKNIDTAKKLATLMAGKARILQRTACKYLEPLLKAYEAAPAGSKPKPAAMLDLLLGFRSVLMPEVGAEEFSDIFAQTLTYGMFAARLNDKTPETFSRFEAMSLIPNSNPFLKKLFVYVGSSLEDEVEWIVDDLAELFKCASLEKIMKGYGRSSGKSDPMVHFYEDFLNEYDAGLRKNRGVWYTPIQVVGFIVRAVDWMLQNRFAMEDGLADDSMTDVEIEQTAFHGKKTSEKVKKTVHRVQVLDPSTGTGTFLAEVVRQVHTKFVSHLGKWGGYVEKSLLPRLNGFELLMASYTMAHVKLDFALRETGVTPTGKERFRIFLTDSLTECHSALPGGLFASALGEEQQKADEVKRDTPVMVVMGNPPYSGESQNKGDWIMRLMESYKVEPGGKVKLKERNPKWLNDDYVKFIRLAEHYVEKNACGIVAYITPHGFLDNPTFRGMRWHLMQTFDEIWTLNLHGNSKKKEVAPDGGKDECVFDIMQGVAITLFVKCCQRDNVAKSNTQSQLKTCKAKKDCRVYYADLWGKKKEKLTALDDATMDLIEWQKVNPAEPMLFFVPKDTASEAEWNAGFGVNELVNENSVGVVTGKDSALVAFSSDELRKNLVTEYKEEINGHLIRPFLHCIFDKRQIYYDVNKIARARKRIMRHFIESDNVAIIAKRGFPNEASAPGFVTDEISNFRYWSNSGMQGGDYVFPLWLYEENMGKVEKRANMNPEIVAKVGTAIGGEASPEDIFAYIYGVLHTPQYRTKFKEFLKTDFPRIPYPKDAAQFEAVVDVGHALMETHLLRDAKPTLKEIRGTFPVAGDDEVLRVVWEPADAYRGKVWINGTQYFDNVPKVAWDMPVGGYRPAEKWLKDRKCGKLGNDEKDHYQRIIIALDKTASLMAKLEKLSN